MFNMARSYSFLVSCKIKVQYVILLCAMASPCTVNPVIGQQMFQISQFIIEYVEDMVHMDGGHGGISGGRSTNLGQK